MPFYRKYINGNRPHKSLIGLCVCCAEKKSVPFSIFIGGKEIWIRMPLSPASLGLEKYGINDKNRYISHENRG